MMNGCSSLGIVGAGRRRCGGGKNTAGGRVSWVGLVETDIEVFSTS